MKTVVNLFESLIAKSTSIRGSDAVNHVVVNTENKNAVSVVQHPDGWMNVRDGRNEEIYDDYVAPSLIEILFDALFGG